MKGFAKVLTRIRVHKAGDGMTQTKLKAADGLVLRTLAEALDTKKLTQGAGIFVEELAKRTLKGKRSTQETLKKVEALNLIRREHQAVVHPGRQPPRRFYIHPLLLDQASMARPHLGADLVFPRSWDDMSVLVQCPSPLQPGVANAVRVNLPEMHVGVDTSAIDADLKAYFDWLIESCRTGGHEPMFEIAAQRRKRGGERDGERGGTFTPPGVAAIVATDLMMPSAQHAIEWARENGAELTFRLHAEYHPLLLVDDLDSNEALRLPWPGARIETSPGNFQGSLVAHRPLTAEERLCAQRALQVRLSGDPGAVSSKQLRRFPGSINRKPNLAQAFIARLDAVPAKWSLPSSEMVDALIAEGRALHQPPKSKSFAVDYSSQSESQVFSGPDQSAVEFGWVIHQLTRKKRRPHDELIRELTSKAEGRRRHNKPPGDPSHQAYARRTLQAAIERLGRL